MIFADCVLAAVVAACYDDLQVEAQIEAVSKTVDEATKALPNLTREQQKAQVGTAAVVQTLLTSVGVARLESTRPLLATPA